jgi:hypothetical protein
MDVTTSKTPPSASPVATQSAVNSNPAVTGGASADHKAPTPASIDTETEAKLTSEITKLWDDRKNGNVAVRRTRAELKALRLALAGKLHAMKLTLVGTGRGGGWASYLRLQRIPVASADRLVAVHEAPLAPPQKKVLTEELSEPTVDQVRQMAQKLLPKLCKTLTTAELAFAFIDEIFWNIEASDGQETDDGFEVFRTLHDDDVDDEDQAVDPAVAAPVAVEIDRRIAPHAGGCS